MYTLEKWGRQDVDGRDVAESVNAIISLAQEYGG